MSEDSVEALVAEARHEQDEDQRSSLLRTAGEAAEPEDVSSVAQRLLSSPSADDIVLGADLIAAMPTLSTEEIAHLRTLHWRLADRPTLSDEGRRGLSAALGPVLTEARDPAVVERCLLAAAALECPDLLDPILGHVDDDDPDVRVACAQALGRVDPAGPSTRAVSALISLVDDTVDDVRDWAITGLGGYGVKPIDTPETRRVFREHVQDSDEGVRNEAVQALGLLGDVEMLALALRQDDVSSDLVMCAARIGDARLHRPLLALRARGWARRDTPDVAAELDGLLKSAITATAPLEPPT